ncbi:MAG TPA: tRNA (adenosine(37)-N6)-threonylcarbamoyltransferase complex dimerization subunit type 1 TsaB, partial [Candidatus Binatia bacterium]|nr:tRNA (adenosine(37)-N6)-threonylcarbamoyltransferase complex dimerization subunit type 1 TsaB [Candidatus Binatia bacterium]
MRILGIDTASTNASAALLEDGRVIADEIRLDDVASRYAGRMPAPHHAEIILPLIDAVLRKGGTSIEEISGIAVSIGPGSFTGLRIGLSTVKGLAYGCAVPVVGVSTLLANAARVT